MNRKGVNYSLLLLIVTLICSVYLIVSFINMSDVKEPFGTVQEGVLMLPGDMRLVETYLGEVSDIVFTDIIFEDFSLADVSCHDSTLEVYDNKSVVCVDLNSQTDFETCIPNYPVYFQEKYNEKISEYIRGINNAQLRWTLPTSGYLVTPLKGYVSVLSTHPTIINIISQQGEIIGEASFKPSIKTYPRSIITQTIPAQIDTITNIVEACSFSNNTVECVNEEVNITSSSRSFDIDARENRFFFFTRTYPVMCFSAYIPKTEL